jgi:hypothetical protein
MGKSWLAYRIKGNRSEKYDGVIRAHTREEAEVKAQAAFGCRTDVERPRVYVRELQDAQQEEIVSPAKSR